MQLEQTIEETKKPVDTDTDQDVVIHIEHLKKSFGDKEVLKDLSLDLKNGEDLVILGRSGQGKSVTIKCIIGLLEQDGGACTVLGKEVRDMSPADLREMRAKVGFLFQSSALYDSMTVAENLAFPLTRVTKMGDRKEIDKLVDEMLDNVGLKDAKDKLPSDLSGGMRKRIGLARTLILKPQIMLYDEPTTGLDPITAKEISHLIITMQEKYKISSIIITHDMACAKITSDRMVILNDGQLVARGTYNELEKSDDELVQSFFK